LTANDLGPKIKVHRKTDAEEGRFVGTIFEQKCKTK
jgi:hypothetical protein